MWQVGNFRLHTLVFLSGSLCSSTVLFADDLVIASNPEPTDQRILGVIPNYQTISDPNAPFVPMTPREKWNLALKESTDPFTAGNALLGAALSQQGNSHPRYGNGGTSYAQRFGAAMADFTTQNIFSAAVLATILHQDPRYYRKGPQKGILARAAYSVSQIVVTRQDSGHRAFNFSGIFGMGLGIAASNLYYPAGSRNGAVMRDRIGTSMTGAVMGNLLSEFWPDINTRLLSRIAPWKKKKTKL